MGAFQYSGGVGAQLARALTSGLEGYESGVNDKLDRAAKQAQIDQTKQQTTNLGYDEPNTIASEAIRYQQEYGVPFETAMDAIRYAHGGPPPPRPIPQGAPPPVPQGPLSGPPAMPSPVMGHAGDLGTAPPPPVPMDPGMTPLPPPSNGSGNLGMGPQRGLPAMLAPFPQAASLIPPPPPVQSAQMPTQDAPGPVAPMPSVGPTSPGPVPMPTAPTDDVPQAPAGPPPYVPFDPQAPPPDPLQLRQSKMLIEGRQHIADTKNIPVMQKTFEASLGNSGILPSDDDDTKAQKIRQQLDAANQMQQSLGYPPNDPTGPLMARVLSSGGILASVKDTTGSDKEHNLNTYFTGKLALGNRNADTAAARAAFYGSDIEQKVIKQIDDLPPGFQQRAAINAWNKAHPDTALPVPDGVNVPYYKPGEAEQSLIGLRNQQAALAGQKSKFYPAYVNAIIGEKAAGAYLATQRGLFIPQDFQLRQQKINNDAAYQDGTLRLRQYGLDNIQARYSNLLKNKNYADLAKQDSSLRTQIDVLNAQEGQARAKLTGQSLTDYLAQTDKLKSDLQQQQTNVENQRSTMEEDPLYSTPQTPTAPILPAPVQAPPAQGFVPKPTRVGGQTIFSLPPIGGAPAAPVQTAAPTVLSGKIGNQEVTFHAPTSKAEFDALTPAKQKIYTQWFKHNRGH